MDCCDAETIFESPIEEADNYMKYADVSGDKRLIALDATMILQKDFEVPVKK